MYYVLVMMWLVYVVGVSAIGVGQGERYRFAVLVFMLPVMIWNVQALHDRFSSWIHNRETHSGGRRTITSPVRCS